MALLLVTLTACSQAPTSFVSKVVFPLGYNNANDAARAGIEAAVTSSTNFERGGGVLQGTDGKFYFTNPVGGKNPGEVQFKVEYNNQKFKLVAIYHTHPAECPGPCVQIDLTEFFSTMDVETAATLNVVSYIGILKTHTMSKYVPNHDPLELIDSANGDGTTESVSLGEPVGTF
ncbi:MAG: DUF4329 domain-containing protein [Thaumarchaeota archaeon]|nr:DUF4329 domain-containing protein [Nitrososphaerota archaeon]